MVTHTTEKENARALSNSNSLTTAICFTSRMAEYDILNHFFRNIQAYCTSGMNLQVAYKFAEKSHKQMYERLKTRPEVFDNR